MALNLFKKNPSADGKKSKKPAKKQAEVKLAESRTDKGGKEKTEVTPTTKEFKGNSGAARVIKNFYVSEKASILNGLNQYVFRVFDSANKNQIRDQVEKLFNVKVKDVKTMNTAKKRRDLGRHPGFKSGFKKAIVVLEKGQSIEQAKP